MLRRRRRELDSRDISNCNSNSLSSPVDTAAIPFTIPAARVKKA
jgi:hypothetical protein